jgi:hypothetical protein
VVSYHSNHNGGPKKPLFIVEKMFKHHTFINPGFTKPEYIFDGLNDQPDGSGNMYYVGQKVHLTKNYDVYVQWKRSESHACSIQCEELSVTQG